MSALRGPVGADTRGGAPTRGPGFRGPRTGGAGGAAGTVPAGVGNIPTTTWGSSSAAERDAGVEAVLPARFDTAIGAEFADAPRPADTDFAGVPGLVDPAVLDECVAVALGGGVAVVLFGDVGPADVLEEPGCDCVLVVDVGPVVWAFGAAVGGAAVALEPAYGRGVVAEFDCGDGSFVLEPVGGGAGFSLPVPMPSDGAVPTCDGCSLGVGPSTWWESSCGAEASSGRPATGAWLGGESA